MGILLTLENFKMNPIRTRTSFSTFKIMGQKHVELSAQRNAFLYFTPSPHLFNWKLRTPYTSGGKTRPSLNKQVNMISAQHSSNNGKNSVARKTSWYVIILDPVNENLSRLELSSWPRERKLNLKLSIFHLKEMFRFS